MPLHPRIQVAVVAISTACWRYAFCMAQTIDHVTTHDIVTNSGRALDTVVKLTQPQQFEGAWALKTEKIVYCHIPKVASAEWTKLMRAIDRQPPEKADNPKFWQNNGLDRLDLVDVDAANEIFNKYATFETAANEFFSNPEWLKFVVVRNPTERLLSSFLQKCCVYNFYRSLEYRSCPYLELWPEEFSPRDFPKGVPTAPSKKTNNVIAQAFKNRGTLDMFGKYVQGITRMVKDSPCEQNPHFAPQYCQCSLSETAPLFSIVGFGPDMTKKAAALIVPSIADPKRKQEVAMMIQTRMGEDRDGKKTGAAALVDEYFSEDALGAVRDAYAKDYELFSAVLRLDE